MNDKRFLTDTIPFGKRKFVAIGGAFVLSFCALDYMARCFTGKIGKNEQRERFIEFSKEFLQNYDSDKLYAIRCNLVHDYLTETQRKNSFRLTHNNFGKHIFEDSKGIYWLNIQNFVYDCFQAYEKYLKQLNLDKKLQEILIKCNPDTFIWSDDLK